MESLSSAAARTRKQHGVRYFLSYARSLFFTNLLIYFYTAVCGTVSLFTFPFRLRRPVATCLRQDMVVADPENQWNPCAGGRD